MQQFEYVFISALLFVLVSIPIVFIVKEMKVWGLKHKTSLSPIDQERKIKKKIQLSLSFARWFPLIYLFTVFVLVKFSLSGLLYWFAFSFPYYFMHVLFVYMVVYVYVWHLKKGIHTEEIKPGIKKKHNKLLPIIVGLLLLLVVFFLNFFLAPYF